MSAIAPRAQAILDYWFGPPESGLYGTYREHWFRTPQAVDFEIRENFLDCYEAAERGECDDWIGDPQSALALTVLLDQFPRNMFRGTARAFALDPKALSIAKHIVGEGWDLAMTPVERLFVYLPYEHSEAMEDQETVMRLFRSMPECEKKQDWIDFAEKHKVIIDRFGRYPHRNEMLGRESTPEELEFLTEGGDEVRFSTNRHENGDAGEG